MRDLGRTAVRGIDRYTVALALLCGISAAEGGDGELPKARVLCERFFGPISALNVSDDGKFLATFEGVRESVRIIDAASGRESLAEYDGGNPLLVDVTSGLKIPRLESPFPRADDFNPTPPAVPTTVATCPTRSFAYALWRNADRQCITTNDVRTGRIAGRYVVDRNAASDPGESQPLYSRLAVSRDGRTVVALACTQPTAMLVLATSAGGADLEAKNSLTGEAMGWTEGLIESAAVTDDGRAIVGSVCPLARAGGEESVACWSTATGKRLWERTDVGTRPRRHATAGRVVAISRGDNIEVFDVTAGGRGTRLMLPPGVRPVEVALGPAGTRLYAGVFGNHAMSGQLLVWQISADLLGTPPEAPPAGTGTSEASASDVVFRQTVAATALAVAPDESLVVTGSPEGDVHVFDVASRKKVRALKGHKERVTSIAFVGSDPAWLASCSDRRVRVWNPATGSLRKELVAPDKDTSGRDSTQAAASAASHVIAFRANDGFEAILWDGEGTNRTLPRSSIFRPFALSLSQDGTRLGAMSGWVGGGNANGYGVIDLRTRKALWSRDLMRADAIESEAKDVVGKNWIATRFTPNGERFIRIANSDEGAHVRSSAPSNGVPQWSLDLPGVTLRDLVFRSDGRALLVTDSGLQILDTREGKAEPASGLPHSVTCAAFGPKSGALYLGLSDGSVVRTSLGK